MARRSQPRSVGEASLLEFRDRLSLEQLRDVLAAFGEDRATIDLRESTDASLDLAIGAHRRALLAWLRAWGCRHLRVADTPRSSAALRRWWSRWSSTLPPDEISIDRLGERDLTSIAPAYTALSSLRVAMRAAAAGDVVVTLGDTAAAKALFALRPRAFPPWDEPIRRAFGVARTDGTGYAVYVEACRDAVAGAARRLQVSLEDLPRLVGRGSSTPARTIDEFLWARITRARP